MKYRDEIHLKLKNEIVNFKNTYIPLRTLLIAAESVSDDMPAFLQGIEGQTVFCDVISRFVETGLIVPVGNKPNAVGGLYQKYRVNKEEKQKNSALTEQIIHNIKLPALLDYYIKNQQDFLDDRDIIDTIVHFLANASLELVTVNERAYELFGDEKFFKGAGKERSRGEVVLKRLGLSYSHLNCRETVEPFFSFQKPNFYAQSPKRIFVIENKDTFWSFKRAVLDGASAISADMVVYGEGKKIISSFQFMDEYSVNPQTDSVFYFGDLDPEGINIYCELLDRYAHYRICPFFAGYQAALEIGLRKKPVKWQKLQKLKEKNIDRFIKNFESAQAEKIKKHLEAGFYIPQEALSAAEMKERFGRITDA